MPTPAPTQLSMCNVALDTVRAGTIADFNENSLSAEKCRIHYPLVISNMLEMHDWSFVNQRVQMALAGSNARPFEWLFAYLIPSNCGQTLRILPDMASAGYAVPTPISGDPFDQSFETFRYPEFPYIVENGILYCNVANAWLEYTINSIDGVLISSTCSDAISADLAWRLAIPIKGDSALKASLQPAAELMWQKAIAADRNRQPQKWGDYVSESIAARHLGHFDSDCF